MIALRERHPSDGDTYLGILDLCERFAVRTYLIVRYRSDSAATRLYRLAYGYYQGEISAEELGLMLRMLCQDYASDSRVRQSLLDTERNWYRWKALKFFLYEYEISLLHGNKPTIEYSYFLKERSEKTIEHILPQAATSSLYWTRQFSDVLMKQLTNALGNLVLTRDNGHYSNKDFPDKRGSAGPGIAQAYCYAQAHLAQEQELAKLTDWTPQQVTDRQTRLADWALTRWDIDFFGLDFGLGDSTQATDEYDE